jgi:two-component system LytT family sensor kinase
MAIITSPLIGFYTVIPSFLFIYSIPEIESSGNYIEVRMAISMLAISLILFFQWLINIWLFTSLDKWKAIHVPTSFRYVVSYALLVGIVFILQSIREERSPIEFGAFAYYPYIGVIANNTFILVLYWLVKNRHEKVQLEIDKTRLDLAQSVAQYEQLKGKIHPHFLFNALHTLKILISKNRSQAEDYIMKLSSYLRFSITEASRDLILIADDLRLCMTYLELQQVRFANSILFRHDLPPELLNKHSLPVLTLQSLAENAIKHNAFTERVPLEIELIYNPDKSITFRNNIIPKRHQELTTGTGLTNLKERFALLGKKGLVITKKQNRMFEVTFETFSE